MSFKLLGLISQQKRKSRSNCKLFLFCHPQSFKTPEVRRQKKRPVEGICLPSLVVTDSWQETISQGIVPSPSFFSLFIAHEKRNWVKKNEYRSESKHKLVHSFGSFEFIHLSEYKVWIQLRKLLWNVEIPVCDGLHQLSTRESLELPKRKAI